MARRKNIGNQVSHDTNPHVVQRQLQVAFGALAVLGPAYSEALRTGLRCERLFVPDSPRLRILALADLIYESPLVAVAAYRGCAFNGDTEERADAAAALPTLHTEFPEEAMAILAHLREDGSIEVAEAASSAGRLMGQD